MLPTMARTPGTYDMENGPPPERDGDVNSQDRLSLPPQEFLASLSEPERMVLVVRDDLYEHSWKRMETDLRNRLQGRPYIFKLVNRIEADLAVIDLLRRYETIHETDLGELHERMG